MRTQTDRSAERVGASVFKLGIARNRLIVRLELATLLYLGLPVVLWLVSWLRPWLGWPLGAALLVAGALAWRSTRTFFAPAVPARQPQQNDSVALWPLLGAVVLAVGWGVCSGAGGLAFCTEDWLKHFAVMRDLTEAPWPVVYKLDGARVPLVYYFGYYLPAAGIAKIAGWSAGCYALMAWTSLGLALAVSWFVLLAGRRPFLAALLFIFANGLDFLGERLVSGAPLKTGLAHLDWWSGWMFLNFPGHYSQLAWAPQHSIAAWCVTGMLAVQLPLGRGLGHAGLLTALAAFWSPFTVAGLVPFALLAAVRERGRSILSISNCVGAAVLVVNILYLQSRSAEPPADWLWNVHDLRVDWPRLALFHLFEWGIFLLFARELRRAENVWLRSLFWTAAATLAIYPLLKLGLFNDWCMRATIPALMLIWAGVARTLLNPPFNTETRLVLLLVIFGAFGSLHESARSWCAFAPNPPAMSTHPTVPGLHPDVARQYFGSTANVFWRHLARPVPPLERELRTTR